MLRYTYILKGYQQLTCLPTMKYLRQQLHISLKRKVSFHTTKLSSTIKPQFYSKLSTSNNIVKCSRYKRLFCSSPQLLISSNGKIPEYLKGIVSKVHDVEEELLEDKEPESGMEDEIIDFLYSRSFHYEELEGNFVIKCPSCGNLNKMHEMFIDKTSGFSVCPWCLWDGCWEELVKFIENKIDSLDPQQLESYLSGIKPISELELSTLNSSLLKNIGIDQLRQFEMSTSDDCSRLVFPLKDENNEKIGYASISIIHSPPEIIIRILEGSSSVFYGMPASSNKKKQVIVVPHILDALYLAKFKIDSVALIADPKPHFLNLVFKNYQSVVLWLNSSQISSNLLTSLRNLQCFSVRITTGLKPVTSFPENKILQMIANAVPILSDEIVSSYDLKSKVYERILKKDQLFGIKWTRFSQLNELLLGHREGELTIFSGQTGTGKTTLMSEYSLDLCMQGVCTLWASFEVNITRLCEVMLQQFHGRELSDNHADFSSLIQEFSKFPMYFLNVHGPQPLNAVIDLMTEAVLVKGVRHVIIDNLQFMLGQQGASADWWLEQDRTVSVFRHFATAYNCHVTLIVHPKKLNIGDKLTMNSISGGARVTQEADNVMILLVQENDKVNSSPKTLQIVKNRYGGTLGEMKLKFHRPSLTLSSCFRKSVKSLPKAEGEPAIEEPQAGRHDPKPLPFFTRER